MKRFSEAKRLKFRFIPSRCLPASNQLNCCGMLTLFFTDFLRAKSSTKNIVPRLNCDKHCRDFSPKRMKKAASFKDERRKTPSPFARNFNVVFCLVILQSMWERQKTSLFLQCCYCAKQDQYPMRNVP